MSTSIVHFITNIRKAIAYAEDVNRISKAKILNKYISRLEWVLTDFKTTPSFRDKKDLIAALNDELKSDPLLTDAIMDKVQLLHPHHREVLEDLIDTMIKGEPLEFYQEVESWEVVYMEYLKNAKVEPFKDWVVRNFRPPVRITDSSKSDKIG